MCHWHCNHYRLFRHTTAGYRGDRGAMPGLRCTIARLAWSGGSMPGTAATGRGGGGLSISRTNGMLRSECIARGRVGI